MIDKVIFLDIDGVLNVYCQGRDEYGCTFHKHFEDNLKWIIEETEAKIVISSSWRLSGIVAMREMWEFRGLAGEIIDITPNLTYGEGLLTSTPRGEEIKAWLDLNLVRRYCIIDDDSDMLTEQTPFFVQTSGNENHSDCVDIGYGLTKECAERVIEILND
jgi:hypothetical protein